MQVVILAGGRGTRLRPLTERLPKCMVSIEGKPFLAYQIELLRACGVRDIVLCLGYLGDQVLAYFGNGARFGVRLTYAWEPNGLLGTAGALKNAQALLDNEFFVTYGDSYLVLDYRAVLRYFRQDDRLGLMVVYRNHDRFERSNVAVADGLVATYDKQWRGTDTVYVNFGLSLLRRRALALVPEGVAYSQEEFFQELIGRRQLLAYETQRPFYEIGSWRGLAQFERLVSLGGLVHEGPALSLPRGGQSA